VKKKGGGREIKNKTEKGRKDNKKLKQKGEKEKIT
jgi:hypothetical protein